MAEFAFQFWSRVDTLLDSTSLKELASASGISYATLKDMRTRRRYPKQEAARRIADYLGTTVDYLMTGKDSTTEPDGGYCAEAQFVQEHPETRVIVRIMMKDLSLVPHLSAVLGAFAQDELKEKKA